LQSYQIATVQQTKQTASLLLIINKKLSKLMTCVFSYGLLHTSYQNMHLTVLCQCSVVYFSIFWTQFFNWLTKF